MKDKHIISLRNVIKTNKALAESCSWTEEEKDKLDKIKTQTGKRKNTLIPVF